MKENIITFKVNNCPLQYGTYYVTVCAYVDGDEADWVQNAFSFEVESGDFYKTGKMPPKEQSDFLLKFSV